VGKLRVHLFLNECFLEIFLCDCVCCVLKCVFMNYIWYIDGRNGKTGGRVLFTGLGLKSRVMTANDRSYMHPLEFLYLKSQKTESKN